MHRVAWNTCVCRERVKLSSSFFAFFHFISFHSFVSTSVHSVSASAAMWLCVWHGQNSFNSTEMTVCDWFAMQASATGGTRIDDSVIFSTWHYIVCRHTYVCLCWISKYREKINRFVCDIVGPSNRSATSKIVLRLVTMFNSHSTEKRTPIFKFQPNFSTEKGKKPQHIHIITTYSGMCLDMQQQNFTPCLIWRHLEI